MSPAFLKTTLFFLLPYSHWKDVGGRATYSPVHTAVLLHDRFSRRGPTHWVVKDEVVVAQRRVRLCQPSPQLTEHELQGDHSSVLASR